MKEHHIEISEDANAYIQSQLVKGNFADASEYVESLIREDRLTREELQRSVADRREELEQMMLEGLNSGEPITVDEEYWAGQRQRLTDELGGQGK